MIEAIYKGATRPAMKWGVPLMALIAVFMPVAIVGVWLTVLVSLWTAPVCALVLLAAFGTMRQTTAKDDQRLKQQALRLRLVLRNKNRAFWHARSYCPHRIGPHRIGRGR